MLLLISLLLAAEPVADPALNAAETKRIEASEIVVRNLTPTNNSGIAVQAVGLVDAPPRRVWPVVRDCQHFASFMPRTKASSLIKVDDKWLCHAEVDLPFPLQDLWSDSSTEDRESPADHFYRSMSLVRGSYDRNSSSWTIVPWGDGNQSLVIFSLDTKPRILIPDVVMRSLQGNSIPDVFAAVRKRVAALSGRPNR